MTTPSQPEAQRAAEREEDLKAYDDWRARAENHSPRARDIWLAARESLREEMAKGVDPVVIAFGQFRNQLRQVLYEKGVRSNPGWGDSDIVAAFRNLLASPTTTFAEVLAALRSEPLSHERGGPSKCYLIDTADWLEQHFSTPTKPEVQDDEGDAEKHADKVAGAPLRDQAWFYVKRDFLAGRRTCACRTK